MQTESKIELIILVIAVLGLIAIAMLIPTADALSINYPAEYYTWG